MSFCQSKIYLKLFFGDLLYGVLHFQDFLLVGIHFCGYVEKASEQKEMKSTTNHFVCLCYPAYEILHIIFSV